MIVIVDYDAGNLTSVKRALDYLKIENRISPVPEDITGADKVIFPGVGHAGAAMEVLKKRGIDTALREAFKKGTPLLGICLGTQIIMDRSEETDTPCIGLLRGNCPKFMLSDPRLKIPHMGWDSIRVLKPQHRLLGSISAADEFYFVHSFYPQPLDDCDVLAVGDYGISFPAIIGRDNLVATQFHPEKSGPVGLRLLEAFASWDGVPW